MPRNITEDCIAISQKTGEIITTIKADTTLLSPLDKKISKIRRDKEHEIAYRRIQTDVLGKFVLLRIQKILTNISAATLGRLTMLATFINYDNKLMLTERKPMRKKFFPAVLNLSESAAKKFIAEIKGKYLIEKSNGLYLSKEYYKGENQKFKRDAKTKLFIDTVQSMYYHMKPSKHKFFGMIIQLVPYINTEYNILCSNPDEKNIDNIKPLKITKLCELLNYDKTHTIKLIDNITGLLFEDDGFEQSLCSIAQFNNSGRTNYRIFVNPRIIYNGSDFNKVEVLCTFFPLAKKVRCYI